MNKTDDPCATPHAPSIGLKGLSAFILMLTLMVMGPVHAQDKDKQAPCPASLNFTFPRLQDDAPKSLCQYQGQVLLVVNTASYCGYTNQYEGLEKLHTQYQGKGFQVIGFPSNDFGGQEPKSNKEIADFCSNTFGVKFPMFAKSSVRGVNANPFYKQLIQQTGVEPGWNFHKYLVGRDGKAIASYPSSTGPLDSKLSKDIERALQ